MAILAAVASVVSIGATIYGAASQADSARKSAGLADAQAKQIEQQMVLALDAYNTMTKPQFDKASNLLWGYSAIWSRAVIEKVVKCGMATCTYTRDDSIYNRIAASTSNVVNRARRSNLRGLSRSQVGAAYDNDFRLDALQASLMIKAVGVAETFESEKEFKWTSFYWQRTAASGQFAQNAFAASANLLVGAGSNLQSGLNGLSSLQGIGLQGAELRMKGQDRQSDFAGGFGAIGGQLAGMAKAMFGSLPSTSGVGETINGDTGAIGSTTDFSNPNLPNPGGIDGL